MGQKIIDTKGEEQLNVVRKLYADMWGSKAEKMALFMDDGTMFVYGGNSLDPQNPNAVNMSFGDMLRSLVRKGKGFQNVTAIVHNHDFGINKPSDADVRFLDAAKKYGFNGKYMIYDLAGRILHEPDDAQLELVRKGLAKRRK